MKSFKIIFTCLSMFLFIGTGFSQSKAVQKAMDKVEKLNAQIVSADESAALTDAQKEEIQVLYVQLAKDSRKIKKGEEGTDEEKKAKMKELRKAVNKKVNKEILTKEQRQAKKAARAAAKE